MNAGAFGWNLNADPALTDAGTFVTNPNILMIMVDQLRVPQFWLTPSQQSALDTITPNIAFIRKNGYNFTNFYAAAQNCTPSRATLLTGLYAPQTGMFATETSPAAPDLNTGFPTFGNALHDIAGYNKGNILWFGKWHLSNLTSTSPDKLPQFGFNGGVNVGRVTWPSVDGSPNGVANEGNNGYAPGHGSVIGSPCDAAIATNFNNFWSLYAPTNPWFACVSFVNPHDISFYPGFYPPYEPTASQGQNTNPYNSSDTRDFQPSVATVPTALLSTVPSPWNYEGVVTLNGKSVDVSGTVSDATNFLQPYYLQNITDASSNIANTLPDPSPLTSSQYKDFLNWYFYMIQLVDAQIGNVLTTAIPGYSSSGTRNPSATTAIMLLSDHGEYGGSHGLHSKGGSVYEETLRVPLYVSLPHQSGSVQLNQMCSMVDIFKLVVELALGTTYAWSGNATYLDQANNLNQSLLSFIQNNALNETRAFTGSDGKSYAYILTTTDETYVDIKQNHNGATNINCSLRNHVMCIRTKSDSNVTNPASAFTGGKLALYSKWLQSPPSYNYPIIDATLRGTDLIVQDYEYYDYLNYQNRYETGNDYVAALTSADSHGITGSGPGAHALLVDMAAALGNMAKQSTVGGTVTPASGLAATILTRPLSGTFGGNAMTNATHAAISDWYTNFISAILSQCPA